MRWSAARLLVVLFALSSAAEPPQDAPVTVITPQAVSNLNERAGTLLIEGEVRKFTELLADDFKASSDWSMLKHAPNPIRKMERAEYVKELESLMRQFALKKYETKIRTITISPDGQKAEVKGTAVQSGLFRPTGGLLKLGHEEHVFLEIRNGRIQMVQIHGVGNVYEYTPPPDEKPRDPRAVD